MTIPDVVCTAARFALRGFFAGLASRDVRAPRHDPRAVTAVILVSGFNAMGLHTLFNVVRLFGKDVRNVFFVQAGIIDADKFKGRDELDRLERDVRASPAKCSILLPWKTTMSGIR